MIWLRVKNPVSQTISSGTDFDVTSTEIVYKFKKSLLTAEARISHRAFSISNISTKFETEIEFEAKLPIRRPDRYTISASAVLQNESLRDFHMVSENVNRSEVEEWNQVGDSKFVRKRTHQKNIELSLPQFISEVLLPAPLATRALADSWCEGAKQYNAILLAGKKLVALKIEPAPASKPESHTSTDQNEMGLQADGVSLAIEFLKFGPDELEGRLENFNHLRWNGAQKLRAVYSRAQKQITRFELELPIFGALAMQKIES